MLRSLLSVAAAGLLALIALGYTVFSARAVAVSCTRTGGLVSCAERETIGPYLAWSRAVEDIAIARDMSGSSDANGVVAETKSGEQVPLTSSFLDDHQQADIANRIHQFIFVQRDQDTLAFNLPPSWLNLGLGGAFVAAALVWGLVSLVAVGRRLLGGRGA